jgi:integrase
MAVYPERRKGRLTGVWIAEITINGARAGRERFQSQKEAQRWYDHMKLLGAPPPGGREREKPADVGPTVGDVVREHLREYEGRDKNHARHLHYIEDRWGLATPIKIIDERHLDMLANSLKDRPGYQGRKKLTSATINRYLSAASGLLSFAKRKKYLKETPVVPWREEDGRRVHWLTVEEEEAVGAAMLAAGAVDAEVTLRVLCRTGMRWGEFEGLTPGMVTDSWVRLDRTKTNTPRDIPIVPELAAELRSLVERGGIKYDTFRVMMTDALKIAGQNAGLTPHCLRHTAATRLVHAGFPLPNIKEFMGHRSIQTTMKYVHVAPRHLEDAAKILSCNAGQSPKSEPNSADIIRLRRA